MYNDKNRQNGANLRAATPPRMPYGRSCPNFVGENDSDRGDIPSVDDRIGRRLCDGSLPDNDDMSGCGTAEGGKRVLIHSVLHISVRDVRVDLRGVELFMAENVLQNADVDVSRLIHQRRGGVTELVHRIVL